MNRVKLVSVNPEKHQVRNLSTLVKIELEENTGWLATTWSVVSHWNIGNPADDRVVHYLSLGDEEDGKATALAVYEELVRDLSGSRSLCLKNYQPKPKVRAEPVPEPEEVKETKEAVAQETKEAVGQETTREVPASSSVKTTKVRKKRKGWE